MKHHNGRYARLRYTATGALAALAAVGAIAGAVALAANPRAKGHGRGAVANGPTKAPAPATANGPTKAPAPATANGPTKTPAPQQPGSSQPFLTAVQRLVTAGTITMSEGQAVDREVLSGSIDKQTLAASGLTPSQLQAVNQAFVNTKRALAANGQ